MLCVILTTDVMLLWLQLRNAVIRLIDIDDPAFFVCFLSGFPNIAQTKNVNENVIFNIIEDALSIFSAFTCNTVHLVLLVFNGTSRV